MISIVDQLGQITARPLARVRVRVRVRDRPCHRAIDNDLVNITNALLV
jgi:hypothetical protein